MVAVGGGDDGGKQLNILVLVELVSSENGKEWDVENSSNVRFLEVIIVNVIKGK